MTVDQGGYPPETGSAQTLGDIFRNTRTSAGVSVEQVESDLRIKAKYIEAIEDGDTVALPSRAYTDGFLRNYATYLGLDPADSVRRFASEQGLTAPTTRIATVAPMPGAKNTNSLTSSLSSEPRRGFFAALGRGVAAAMPLLLVAGVGFGGYTGFVAARDAGLIPAQFGGEAQSTGSPTAAVERDKTERATRTRSTRVANTPKKTDVAEAEDEPAAKPADAPKEEVEVAEAAPDLVGEETSTGRPDSLAYARSGNTPYWRAKPPAVEPADGPVSEIEPEEAGLLRADASDDEDEKPNLSRWSSSGANDTPPTGVDASRIAAAAREALGGASTGLTETDVAEADAVEAQQIETAAIETADILTDTDDGSATSVSDQTESAPAVQFQETQVAALSTAEPATPQFGIGPVVIDGQPSSLDPVQPQQAPRRFALVAGADTWVQVTDAIGNVAYTGILSPGEAYNIPEQQGLRLKTGNAGGLFIEVDGLRFGPLGSNGAVMRNVVLNPGAVRASFTLSQAASLVQ